MELAIKFDKDRTELRLKKFIANEKNDVLKGVFKAGHHLRTAVDIALARGTYKIKTRKGGLRASLGVVARIISGGAVGIMGTNLIYARIQEKGGKINVTQRMSRFAWYKFSETGDTMWKAIALSKGRQITIPAHWYMRKTAQKEKKEVLRIVSTTYMDGYKS